MNKTKRVRKTCRLTAAEFVEYMTVKTMEQLATMPPSERKARLAAARRVIVEARANRGRSARIRASRASSQAR
jgi:hypothetical protein